MKGFGSSLPTTSGEASAERARQRLHHRGIHIAQCTTCHGAHGVAPSPIHARRSPAQGRATCARCHSDAAYMRSTILRWRWTSWEIPDQVHGMRNQKGTRGSRMRQLPRKSRILPTPSRIPRLSTRLPDLAAATAPEHMKGTPSRLISTRSSLAACTGALLEKEDLGAPPATVATATRATPPGWSRSQSLWDLSFLNADLFAGSRTKRPLTRAGFRSARRATETTNHPGDQCAPGTSPEQSAANATPTNNRRGMMLPERCAGWSTLLMPWRRQRARSSQTPSRRGWKSPSQVQAP